ncbi:MAG: hypothetical protein JXQ73_20835 [Phycisphaerae bacterium]|nr:hypothetical protein [Phycisphaerae bacterium]
MRQRLQYLRGTLVAGGPPSHVLGKSRRISLWYRLGPTEQQTSPIRPRARGIQCFRISTDGPLPLRARKATFRGPALEPTEDTCYALPELAASTAYGDDFDMAQAAALGPVPLGLPTAADLPENAFGLARVLNLLAGEPADDTGDMNASPEEAESPAGSTPLAEQVGPAALGPRLSPSLDSLRAGWTDRLWNDEPRHHQQSPPPAETDADGDLTAWVGPLERPIDEELALADVVGTRVADADLAAANDAPITWPEDAPDTADLWTRETTLACVAIVNDNPAETNTTSLELPGLSGLETTLADRSTDRTDSSDRSPASLAAASSAERASSQLRPWREAPASSRPTDASPPQEQEDEAADQATDSDVPWRHSPETSNTPGTSHRRSWRLRLRWRRPRDPEAIRKQRQEMLRRALATDRPAPIGPPHAPQQRSATMTGSSRLRWRPGDPFAGKRFPRTKRFRWHAMLLTAGTVTGVGYLALMAVRMLLSNAAVSG